MTSRSHSLTEKQLAARRRNARKSTGPRTPAGKRRASLNALRTGEYARLMRYVVTGLHEQPREYAELLAELVDAHRPANAAERLLVEDIAALRWQRLRNQRAQTGQFGREIEHLKATQRRRFLELRNQSCEVSQEEVLEKGLLHVPDSHSKFQQAQEILNSLLAQVEAGEFGDDWALFIRTLYGSHPNMRGAAIFNMYTNLREANYHPPAREDAADSPPQEDAEAPESGAPGEDSDEQAVLDLQYIELQQALLEEARQVSDSYGLYLEEWIRISEARRDACLVPLDPGWVMILRQENSIDRRIERKMRLLMRMQSARRRGRYKPRGQSEDREMSRNAFSTLASDPHE